MRVEVSSERSGLESWQAATAVFPYLASPYDTRIADNGDTRITDSGLSRALD
jgi:hypothetical protein